jgi:hypothetical protein
LVGSSLKSWKMIPILRRIFGHLPRRSRRRPGRRGRRAPGRALVADEQLDQRRLAGARRADEEHEVALGMTRSTSRRATACRSGYCLVTSCRTRTARSCVAGRASGRARLRMERVALDAGATVTGSAPAGEDCGRGASSRSSGLRPHGLGSHIGARLPSAPGPANGRWCHAAPDLSVPAAGQSSPARSGR